MGKIRKPTCMWCGELIRYRKSTTGLPKLNPLIAIALEVMSVDFYKAGRRSRCDSCLVKIVKKLNENCCPTPTGELEFVDDQAAKINQDELQYPEIRTVKADQDCSSFVAVPVTADEDYSSFVAGPVTAAETDAEAAYLGKVEEPWTAESVLSFVEDYTIEAAHAFENRLKFELACRDLGEVSKLLTDYSIDETDFLVEEEQELPLDLSIVSKRDEAEHVSSKEWRDDTTENTDVITEEELDCNDQVQLWDDMEGNSEGICENRMLFLETLPPWSSASFSLDEYYHRLTGRIADNFPKMEQVDVNACEDMKTEYRCGICGVKYSTLDPDVSITHKCPLPEMT